MSRKTATKRKNTKKKAAAKSKQPSFIDIAQSLNKGTKLQQRGELATARKIYQRILAYDSSNYDALQLLGAIELAQGNNDKAVEYISRALTIRSDLPALHYNKGVALINMGQISEGLECLHRALELDPDFLLANYTMGQHSLAAGMLEDAILYLQKANRIRPHHPQTLLMLLNALLQDDKLEHAESLMRSIVLDDSEKAQLFYQIGLDMRPAARWDLSLLMLQKAFELAQENELIVIALAESMERLNHLQDAFDLVHQYSNKQGPCGISFAVIQVRILRRLGHLDNATDEADKYLSQEGSTEHMAELHKEAGMTFDRQGKYSAAWKHFTTSNEIMKSLAQEQGISYSAMPEVIQRSHDWCRNTHPSAEAPVNDSENIASPLFFCGFPRSGTTLMGSMLSRHPKITVTDEVPTLNRIADTMGELIGRKASYPEDLHTLSAYETAHLRKLYWSKLGVDPGKIKDGEMVVDKMPLNFLYLPFALRLFPQAKILFALRDPRDACLSCYMQYFPLNPSMVQFHEIQTTIEMYKLSMGLWEEYKVRLNPDYHEYHYENLVSDTHAELTKILHFIGVDWDDAPLKQDADTEQTVSTPSYESIINPINNSAISKWCRYKEHLHPVINELQSFIKRYNYDI